MTPLKTPCPGCGAPMHAVEWEHGYSHNVQSAKARVVAVCEQMCRVTVESDRTCGHELPLVKEAWEAMG